MNDFCKIRFPNKFTKENIQQCKTKYKQTIYYVCIDNGSVYMSFSFMAMITSLLAFMCSIVIPSGIYKIYNMPIWIAFSMTIIALFLALVFIYLAFKYDKL